MMRVNLTVLLMLVCAFKCLAMSYNELEEFADYLEKTAQLSPTLKKGVDPDDDDDDDGVSDYAWEESGKFEGDLVLNERQRRLIVENVVEGLSRNGIRDGAKRWPNNEVIYFIQVEHFSSDHVQAITDGIQDLARASCVKFRPYRKGDRDAVVIQGNRRGCFSQVGYQGGYQVLNLSGRHPVGRGCFRHGTIVHEMLHTLGFYHMQSSPDRDDYVSVRWENIIQNARHNFRKYQTSSVSDFGVEYDYDSVLHYGRRAFSTNGQDTIVPKKSGVQIGQRLGLSDKDVEKLNRMYCDANSDHVEADDDANKKSKKKKNGNKPFDGHGIGYHQGKAVVIKLLPATETHKLIDVPSSHVFDYFSKAPQILSPSQSKGLQVGKEIEYSYNAPKTVATQGYTNPIDYSTEHKIQSIEIPPRAEIVKNENVKDDKDVHANIVKADKPKNNHDDPALTEAFDRLEKIIKSHVYPSQTPDLSIYKTYEHRIEGENSPSEAIKELIDPDPSTKEPLLQEEKTKAAIGFINNLYDFNSQQSLKVSDDKYFPKPATKEALVVAITENKDKNKENNKKPVDPSYIISFSDNYKYENEHSSPIVDASLRPYQEDQYEKFISKIHDVVVPHNDEDKWHSDYTPYKYKSSKYRNVPILDYSKHDYEGGEHDYKGIYSSSDPTRLKYSYQDPFPSERYNNVSDEEAR